MFTTAEKRTSTRGIVDNRGNAGLTLPNPTRDPTPSKTRSNTPTAAPTGQRSPRRLAGRGWPGPGGAAQAVGRTGQEWRSEDCDRAHSVVGMDLKLSHSFIAVHDHEKALACSPPPSTRRS
jgi:hypothetical protein